MAGRSERTRVQSSDRARPRGATTPTTHRAPTAVRRPASAVATDRASRIAGLPLDTYRLIAAVVLVLMLLIPLFAPLGPSRVDTAPFITPQIDGSDSVVPGYTGLEIERAVFPYLSLTERSQSEITSVWPEAATVLSFEPDSLSTRRAIVGQLYAESSGSLSKKIKDTGLQSDASSDTLEAIEAAYQQMTGDESKPGKGLNGLGAILLVRSLKEAGEPRALSERAAIFAFLSAVIQSPETWQFTYNWSMANLLAGNYANAYDGLRTIAGEADKDNDKLIPFWMGVAALRAGNPFDAINHFNSAINARVPQGGNQAFADLYAQARDASQEGLGDAQWAWQQPAEAYKTYFNILQLGGGSGGLYAKWLRLGLQHGAYEKLAADMADLANTSNLGKEARIHHDRARLLSFLGRQSEADTEYQRALQLGENDPALLISYGQALESRGDHAGAIFRAEQAINNLHREPTTPDLAEVARAATTSTTSVANTEISQQLLDANLLRARAYGAQGQTAFVDGLVANMTQEAGQLPPEQSGLVSLYGAFAYEAAGQAGKARDRYQTAWDKLKGLAAGSPGRAAALAGLARESAAASGFASLSGPQDGLGVLKANGYDPSAHKSSISQDLDAPDVVNQESALLRQAGQDKLAANAQRVAAIVRNLQDAQRLGGVGRLLWRNNGTVVPSNGSLVAADAELMAGGGGNGLAIMRYRQASGLDPALATAWNNLGVLYSQAGRPDLAHFYLSASGQVSPGYALGEHNEAVLAYKQGDFFTAEAAQGAAIKALGPQSLSWGYDLRMDNRGPLPAPSGQTSDFLGRLPAILIILLLLVHTLVGNDRLTNRMGLVPTKGLLGRLGSYVDARAKIIAPGLIAARSDGKGLAIAVGIPSIIGMLALAWGAAYGTLSVAWVFLPVALLVSLIAFGGNELAQYLAARRSHNSTLHHIWPLGALIGVLSIPFGFLFGWQVVTRVQPAIGAATEGEAGAPHSGIIGRRSRTTEDLELAYEAQAEAAAEADGRSVDASVPVIASVAGKSRLGLSAAGRILFAGLAVNLLMGVLFGAVYWLTGWPSMRLGMFASMLVLAFTAVSEPPADGWTIYRRNRPLWLALFVFAAAMCVLVASGVM
jgi:tetratricopeptide (TPR) repeat protein